MIAKKARTYLKSQGMSKPDKIISEFSSLVIA